MFDCILVNGDSYSAKIRHDVYSDVLHKKSGLPVVNIARQGSNNDRIRRSTIEKLIELKQQYTNPLVIVGWSFIRRMEVWYYGESQQVINRIPDRENIPEHCKPSLVTLDVLTGLNQATVEQKCLINEDLFVHKQLTDFYTSLYTFAHTVESLGAKLFCFSAAKNVEIPVHSFPYIQSLHQVQWCQQQNNLYQLHDFYIKQWAEQYDPLRKLDTGHLSESGHAQFADVLIQWLSNIEYNIKEEYA